MSPEEEEAEVRRRRELADMAHHDSVTATVSLIESLNEDQLATLKAILSTTMGDTTGTYTMHTIGFISARQHHEFGVCLACGEKHDRLPLTTDVKEEPDAEGN